MLKDTEISLKVLYWKKKKHRIKMLPNKTNFKKSL